MPAITQPTVPVVPRPERASWSTRVFSLPVVQGLLLVYPMLFLNWAGYLECEEPDVKQRIDSRVDIFVHEGVMADYLNAVKVKDTDAVLEKYRIRYVLLPHDYPMAHLLAHETDWKKTYDDGQAVGFERVR